MGSSAMKVTGINHVVLHVNDMDRSIAFYVGLLGFENRRDEIGADRNFLRCGMQGLDLFQHDGDVHGGEEMNHMALNVAADDLDVLIGELVEAGVDASERTNRNSVFISDPDGHRIEMLPHTAHERERERETADAAR